jgi:KUP system potassium uptake protein
MRYGFMESPDVPRALERCKNRGLDIQFDETTYFLGRETVMPTDNPGMAVWRERLFALLTANAQSATAFYKIPPSMVIEIGAQIEI